MTWSSTSHIRAGKLFPTKSEEKRAAAMPRSQPQPEVSHGAETDDGLLRQSASAASERWNREAAGHRARLHHARSQQPLPAEPHLRRVRRLGDVDLGDAPGPGKD